MNSVTLFEDENPDTVERYFYHSCSLIICLECLTKLFDKKKPTKSKTKIC